MPDLSREDILRGLIALLSEPQPEESRYYTQYNSPLGHKRHLLLARRGVLEAYKLGKTVYIRRELVHEYIEQHKIKAKSKPDEPAKAGRGQRGAVPDPLGAVKGI